PARRAPRHPRPRPPERRIRPPPCPIPPGAPAAPASEPPAKGADAPDARRPCGNGRRSAARAPPARSKVTLRLPCPYFTTLCTLCLPNMARSPGRCLLSPSQAPGQRSVTVVRAKRQRSLPSRAGTPVGRIELPLHDLESCVLPLNETGDKRGRRAECPVADLPPQAERPQHTYITTVSRVCQVFSLSAPISAVGALPVLG